MILMFSGIGYTLAPFFGSLLFDKVGQISPYVLFAAIQIAFSVSLPWLMSNRVNDRLVDSVVSLKRSFQVHQSLVESQRQEKITKGKQVKNASIRFIDFFIYRRILFPILAGCMFQYQQSSMEPIFANWLKEVSPEINQVQIGGIYTITPICFIIGNIICQILRNFLDRRVIIMCGTLVNAGGAVMLGPSHVFGLPNKLSDICIGCGLIGIGCAMVFPNALPEITFQVNAVFKLNKDYNNNMAAGIFRLL